MENNNIIKELAKEHKIPMSVASMFRNDLSAVDYFRKGLDKTLSLDRLADIQRLLFGPHADRVLAISIISRSELDHQRIDAFQALEVSEYILNRIIRYESAELEPEFKTGTHAVHGELFYTGGGIDKGIVKIAGIGTPDNGVFKLAPCMASEKVQGDLYTYGQQLAVDNVYLYAEYSNGIIKYQLYNFYSSKIVEGNSYLMLSPIDIGTLGDLERKKAIGFLQKHLVSMVVGAANDNHKYKTRAFTSQKVISVKR